MFRKQQDFLVTGWSGMNMERMEDKAREELEVDKS